MKSKQEYFVPLNVQRKYWQNAKNFIFLDKIFEAQFSREELSQLEYKTIEPIVFKYNKQEIDFFEGQLIHFFQCELNHFHGVDFDFTFWRKLFTPYLKNCITNIFSKVEELSNLVHVIPDSSFYTFSYSKKIDVKFLKEFGGLFSNEKYNNYLFAEIAEKFFNFNVVYDNYTKDINPKKEISHIDNNLRKKTFIEKVKNGTFSRLIKYVVKQGLSLFFKQKLLLWCTYFSDEAIVYFFKKSFGIIRTLAVEKIDDNADINFSYRDSLRINLRKYFNSSLPLEKQVVIELLPEILPFFFIENFNKYLNTAETFLRKNKTVKCFFATCTYCRGTQPFLLTYAQAKGLTVLTEMHGGDYGIMADRYNIECFLNDTLYTWGAWANDICDTSCKMRIAPSYRQHLLYDGKVKNTKYILFLGSWNEYNISSWHLYLSGHNGVHASMGSEIEFFKRLNVLAIKSILVRNYMIDFGYHFNDILHAEIPNLRIQNYLQSDYDENFDPIARNDSFAQTLLDCSLILVNEFETCFIEALYCEKPFVILFNKYNLPLRVEEIPYFKMMEDVGLLFYDWNKAAELVNEIYDDISTWWLVPERQKVVKIIRDRYSIKVPDPKKWWYKEFMRQIKISKRESKERKYEK